MLLEGKDRQKRVSSRVRLDGKISRVNGFYDHFSSDFMVLNCLLCVVQ